MSEPVTLFQRPQTSATPERLTIAKIRRPLSKAAENLMCKTARMEVFGEARDMDDALDMLRLSNDADYLAVQAEQGGTVAISKAAPDAPSTFDILCAYAKRMVDMGQARDVASGVDALGKMNHPAYRTWMDERTPASTTVHKAAPTTPGEVERVVKAAQDVRFAKKRAVESEINKRAAALVRAGKAPNELEALSAVFKADRALYEEYRASSYADGPLPPAPEPARTVAPDPPAYALAKQMALELKQNDPWGEHAGKSQQEMIETVLRGNRELYEAVRQESYSRG